MFKRPHHQKVATVLAAMNTDFLRETKCYFGGGTAIALLLGEYRESVDLDFMCADQEGYRKLRASVFARGLGDLFPGGVQTLRDVRADRDGIRTILVTDGMPIKFEIVREARIGLGGREVPEFAVPCLTRNDMFAEKLLANADRYADKAAMSRDLIDLLVMERNWGPIPKEAWDKASNAYGDAVYAALRKAKDLLVADHQYLDGCLQKMGIGEDTAVEIKGALGIAQGQSPNHGR